MSNQLHNGESDRRMQVKFRSDAGLVERFDALVEQSDQYDNRSEALRAGMERMIGSADETGAPQKPPTDNDHLREAYLTLVALANPDGVIPHELAVAELSTKLGKSRKVIERNILRKLRKRGYLGQKVNSIATDRSWKLRGVDR